MMQVMQRRMMNKNVLVLLLIVKSSFSSSEFRNSRIAPRPADHPFGRVQHRGGAQAAANTGTSDTHSRVPVRVENKQRLLDSFEVSLSIAPISDAGVVASMDALTSLISQLTDAISTLMSGIVTSSARERC